MDAEAIDTAADDVLVYDLDLFERQLEEQPEPRTASYPLEPAAWIEHRCPACRETYGSQVEVCPLDGQALDDVIVSMPFLWLG